MTTSDLSVLAPFIAAILVAAAILVIDFVFPGRRGPALAVAFAGLALVGLLTALVGQEPLPKTAFDGAYVVDALTTFLDILFITIVALTIAFAPDYLEERDLPVAEFAAVLVFAMSGAMLIAGSADLLVMFLGLELMVLPGYVMAGYHKSDGYSTEGAIKYFLLGSFSSAILLFGLAFVWGLTGTTRIAGVSDHAPRRRERQRPVRAGAGPRPRVPDHGRRVQDRGGPVPLLDAGRVPGLADARHGLPVGGPEDRRVRADHPAVRGRARPAGRRLERRDHGPRGPDDDARQPGRARPGQRQADARLLLDRPHGLHAGRVRRLRGRARSRACRACSTTAPRTRS